MRVINKAILIGNLGADPEVRTSAGGVAVANLRIATSERMKKDGEWVDHTEWHRVTCFGKTAENVGRFLTKGRPVYIEGRIQTREWEKDGVKRWSTEIVANSVRFLGSKDGGGSGASGASGGGAADDGIPF